MANVNASASVVPLEPSEQRGNLMVDSNVNVIQSPMDKQNRTSFDGPVGIFGI